MFSSLVSVIKKHRRAGELRMGKLVSNIPNDYRDVLVRVGCGAWWLSVSTASVISKHTRLFTKLHWSPLEVILTFFFSLE